MYNKINTAVRIQPPNGATDGLFLQDPIPGIIINLMKPLTVPILFIWVLACLLFSYIEAARAADKTPYQSHFTILGLVIGDGTSEDIFSRLGPTIPIKDDVNQLCYVSDKDETLIIFTTESSQCTGFKMMSQKMKFYKWHFCEKSPLVSKGLATVSGIKLGISKSRLKAILGTPRNESDKNLDYVYEWQQKQDPAETKSDLQGSREAIDGPYRMVKATIRAQFSDDRLISFDLSKISQ